MSSIVSLSDQLERLREILQDLPPKDFEKLAAALLANVLNVGISVASSGFQFGGDGGTSGRENRRLRIEAKRYSDTTRLSNRELGGEVDDALAADPQLEGWFLVATKAAGEQVELTLQRKAESAGLPIVIIDWRDDGPLPPLAALCTAEPSVVETWAGQEAGRIASSLAGQASSARERLQRELASWNLGLDELKALSHEKLLEGWRDRASSMAHFGQDVAGGANDKWIRRRSPSAKLTEWWSDAKQPPLVVLVGLEGTGKTWAGVGWLVDALPQLPIVLTIPSGALARVTGATATQVRRLIAEALYELAPVRDVAHWERRVQRLLAQPEGAPPSILLFFDGLNQEPGAPWLDLLKVLQAPPFAGAVRVIASTRNSHLNDRLGSLKALVRPPVVVPVEAYTLCPGGELEERLQREGMTLADLPGELVELARVPRLFSLVILLKSRLAGVGKVTLHRLLWEYGRDSLGVRAGSSFSEGEWLAWLQRVASRHLAGMTRFNADEMRTLAAGSETGGQEAYRRLSDIVDSSFVDKVALGRFELAPTIVSHALGAALLVHLLDLGSNDETRVTQEVTTWLDPIAGLDQRAEIVRAAVNILLEQPSNPVIEAALLAAWLGSQNLPPAHTFEVARLADQLVASLLQIVEHAADGSGRAAREHAVAALIGIRRDNMEAATLVFAAAERWFSEISRGQLPVHQTDTQSEQHRSARLIERVGTDQDGPVTILGREYSLVSHRVFEAKDAAPSIMQGFPLLGAINTFERVAVEQSVGGFGSHWDYLKWIVLLNEQDFPQVAAALHTRAHDLLARPLEAHVHADVRARAAALLLWLAQTEEFDEEAAQINPASASIVDYERDYLSDPGRSFFRLERRHAEQVVLDQTNPISKRLQKVQPFLADPRFSLPEAFCSEVDAAMSGIDLAALDQSRNHSQEDHHWESLATVMARCSPSRLGELARARLKHLASRDADSFHAAAFGARAFRLVADEDSRQAAAALRAAHASGLDTDTVAAANELIGIENSRRSPLEHAGSVINAGLKTIYTVAVDDLHDLSADDVETLLGEFRGDPRKEDDLLRLLSTCARELGATARAWVLGRAMDAENEERSVAFKVLQQAAPEELGRALHEAGWSWADDQDEWIKDYGSRALAAATLDQPAEEILPRLAPWIWTEAFILRGCREDEAGLFADVLDELVCSSGPQPEDPGSEITVSLERRAEDPSALTIELRPTEAEQENPFEALTLSQEERASRRREAVMTAVERTRAARAAGARLHLHLLDIDGLRAILGLCASLGDKWADGCEEPTEEFRRRLLRAEGLYILLFELLLESRPELGIKLWSALRRHLRSRFTGDGSIDELLHLLFRVPASEPLAHLRECVVALDQASTDLSLADICLAARLNGQDAWLAELISSDVGSGVEWRGRRALFLASFAAEESADAEILIPDEGLPSSTEAIWRGTALHRRKEAWQRFWWQKFASSEDRDEAFAAWLLLLTCADRRLYIFMHETELKDSQRGFLRSNWSELERAMKKNEKKFTSEFLGRKVREELFPWSGLWPGWAAAETEPWHLTVRRGVHTIAC